MTSDDTDAVPLAERELPANPADGSEAGAAHVHTPDATPDDVSPTGPPNRVEGRAPRVAAHGPKHHTSKNRHRLRKHFGGWRRSPFDPRRLIADTWGIHLRTEVDPRADLPPVFDQGQLGSCTANATAAAFQYDAMLDGNLSGPLARLWIYYQERKLEGTLGQGDTGARGSDAFKVATQIGIPAEINWPYDITTFAGPPPQRATRDEGFYRLTKPYATPLLTKHSFKQIFSNQQTISFGFDVYESFESSTVAKTGIVPNPKPNEEILGGHEVLAVGYLKSEPDYVLVRNSWGCRHTGVKGWGINGSGYFLMPWRMILNPDICGDWTTIVRPIARR
jgi:C1A family cysteine protease